MPKLYRTPAKRNQCGKPRNLRSYSYCRAAPIKPKCSVYRTGTFAATAAVIIRAHYLPFTMHADDPLFVIPDVSRHTATLAYAVTARIAPALLPGRILLYPLLDLPPYILGQLLDPLH